MRPPQPKKKGTYRTKILAKKALRKAEKKIPNDWYRGVERQPGGGWDIWYSNPGEEIAW
jgi:hypothetical protein